MLPGLRWKGWGETLGVQSLPGVSGGLWCLVLWEELGSPLPATFVVPCCGERLHHPSGCSGPNRGVLGSVLSPPLTCCLLPALRSQGY